MAKTQLLSIVLENLLDLIDLPPNTGSRSSVLPKD
jgi:hypothetical protein